MALERVSSLNLSRLRVSVEADSNGLPYNPATAAPPATVDFAFLESATANPGSSDWKAGTWDTTLVGTHVAQCLVGPSSAVALAAGEYYVWIRITDTAAGETPVECVGKLIVS